MVLARYPANFSYWPVVDSYAEDPFLPVDPLEALMTGMFTRVPFISGTVLYEVLPSSQWHALHQCYFLTYRAPWCQPWPSSKAPLFKPPSLCRPRPASP